MLEIGNPIHIMVPQARVHAVSNGMHEVFVAQNSLCFRRCGGLRWRDYRDCRGPAALSALTAVTFPVAQVVQGSKMMEGGGVRICRTVGTGQLRNLDPFLMLVSSSLLL